MIMDEESKDGSFPTWCRIALLGIMAFAVLVRLAVTAPRWTAPLNDPDNYLPLARAIAEGRGLSWKGRLTAYRPPLYPLVLAAVGGGNVRAARWGVLLLHLSLGAATVAATALAARRWRMPPAQTLLAAGIVAFDPVLVVQAASVMTETLAAFLVAAVLAAEADPRPRRGALIGGLLFGLGALCRPSLLPAAVLSAAGLLLRGPGTFRARVVHVAILGMATVAPLAPWAIRNTIVFGEPVWTTTHGGYTLALANNPSYYDDVLRSTSDAVWTGPNQQAWFERVNRQYAGWSEPRADRALRTEGARMLVERPGDFLRATLARLSRFWGFAPSAAVYPRWLRLMTAAWTVPLWLALAIGLIRGSTWGWPQLSAVAFLVGLTAVHALYWTDLRMRAPIVPAIALIACSSLPRGPARVRAGTLRESA